MYWRLSGFYFFYFASLGALIPYWGLYLKSQGFNAVEIGELIAIIMATKIIAPNIWGWIADHTGRRMRIIRIASLLAALSFCGVFIAHGYWWLALVMGVFSFFWNAALPQFEATTLSHLGDETHRYSSIRLWGSIGFIVSVAGLGAVLDFTGTGLLPEVLVLLFAAIWFSSLAVPERAAGQQAMGHEPILTVLRRPAVISLLLVCFLIQASHGPYYTFYSLYLTDHGYSESAIGQLWALGVVAEIGVFLRMHHWLPRFGARRLLLAATLLTALRWLLLALFVDQPGIMIFVQTLHAASFGVYHAVAIHLVHRQFVGRHQGRGQALYSSLSFGAGGAIGSLLAGYVWEGFGAQWMYAGAALTALLAGIVAWRGIREETMSVAP
ncbi:PPP family 3-phenylpropionic acid transporter [Thiogranum longum]|uniref:PPP family 3-phenylpropionic acid transporter n=2 Tax=Thiogranum longum TaxID=1537524 RepID=A0A4R1HDR8_9GAMM|nr:PPP family 3-phenylpropionic acid transporter [Thiogranum longum]